MSKRFCKWHQILSLLTVNVLTLPESLSCSQSECVPAAQSPALMRRSHQLQAQNHKRSLALSPSPLKPIDPRHRSLFRVFFHLLPSVRAHHPASLENKVFNSLCVMWKHKVRRFPLVEGKGHDPGWKWWKCSQGPWALWECFSTLDPALCHYRDLDTCRVFIITWSFVLLFKLWASSKQTSLLIYFPAAPFENKLLLSIQKTRIFVCDI